MNKTHDAPDDDGISLRNRAAILGVLRQCPAVERVVLFGSRATGTYSDTSDIDLVLEGNLTLTDQTRLSSQLEALTIPYNIDLVRACAITSPELKAHVRQYGKKWQ